MHPKLSKYGRNTDGTFSNGNVGKTTSIESLLEGQAEAANSYLIDGQQQCPFLYLK